MHQCTVLISVLKLVGALLLSSSKYLKYFIADKTENILWRVQNQGLENVKPKIIVLHVGTNNTQNTPDEIVDGIIEIIKAIRYKFPDVYIVFPVSIYQ